MTYRDRIEHKLTAAFAPATLIVRDDSEQHIGHSGYLEGGETHFHVTIRATAFAGMGRVQRHRAVMAALADELAERVHALALDVDSA